MEKILSILTLIKDYKKYFIQSLVVSIIFIFLGMPGPYLTKLLIDKVYPTRSFNLLYFIVFATFFMGLITTFIGFFHSYFMTSIGTKISMEIRLKLFNKLQKLTFDFYDQHKTGEIITRFSALQASVDGIVSMFNTIILGILSIVLFLPLLIWLDWRLTIISMITLPLELSLMYYSGKKLKEKNKIATEVSADASAKLYESLNTAKTIKSLSLEEKFYQRNYIAMDKARDSNLIATLVNQLFGIVFSFIGSISGSLNMLVGWGFILNNEISLGTFIAFGSYVANVRSPLKSLVNLISSYQQLVVYIDRFNEYYNMPPEPNYGHLEVFNYTPIEFKNVSFGYNSDRLILDRINLKIDSGEKILIYGSSGIGKTTFAQLLVRFYEVTDGVIQIGHNNIKDLELNSLRKDIICLLQEPSIFNDTLMNNLITDEELCDSQMLSTVSKICCTEEFINKLPNGINSMIYEKGQNLSAGQKQRISLMRGLLRTPKVLILDESTSAIDLITEAQILSNIRIHFPSMTIIMISHRKESQKYFDRIFQLSNKGLDELEKNPTIREKPEIEIR